MNYLMGLDASFFHLIDGVWTNPLLDTLMPALSWAGARLALLHWKRRAVKWTAEEPEGAEAVPQVEYVPGEIIRR
jgi:hypothetical protein